MTPTEKLRGLLDERGVEYRTHGTTDRTWFEVGNISWFVIEREKGNLTADAVFLTPEQAVEVTLGRGTCHPVPIYGFDGEFTEYDYDECSKCGDEWDGDTPNFCPNCGRKVVDE